MTALEKWAREVYGKSAAKPGALRKALFQTSSGIEVKPLYSPDEAPPSIGYPGQYPFTRGIQPTMYRGRFWTMRQYAGFGTAEQTNERFHYLLDSGQTGLSTAFDLPTQMGHDSDSPRARGEVGRVGVAIDSVDDMERLFRGIDLGKVSTSMTINATAATLLALYQAVGEAHGTRAADLSGTIQNDILKEYMARGTYVYPPAPSMRLITDTFEYASKVVPKWNPISISGYHIREAGSTAAQEIAFTLGDGIAYVDAAMKRGLDVDSFAGRLSFFFNVHNNFLEEVAKFRAARRLWARTMKERFKAKDPRSCTLRFHAQTAGSTLTAQQPDNNVVRVAIQALAAVLGGCQSLHTNSRDEALSLPTEASARIALRTQQIVAHESGVCDFIDGLGGSWALESLTDELEAKAVDYLRRIDEMGGMVEAISRQFPQREIEDAAYAAQKEVEEKKQTVVGVNEFVSSAEAPMDMLRIDPKLEEQQIARVKAFRRQRDNSSTTRALSELKKAAEGSENVVPKIVSAVKARATLGEVANAMREVFGEHTK
ncbi:MAG: methylmalonyl-CoA mutase [Deltaproteobacteria bacterium]|nr:MAG: methylmalonyl-CoA mutase [Deltaproteobacteria bacterium]TMA76655.1 MAG: methylmalonyl-CoA mutase [Deltaproteobacteria bacterium]TMB39667.1 MAG: methylmalonyl-CoA mutase [Deltaproteobacteria bacterium]